SDEVVRSAEKRGMNVRVLDGSTVGISLDEATTMKDLADLYEAFGGDSNTFSTMMVDVELDLPEFARRTSDYLGQSVFNRYHTETEMVRYLHRLESRDLALNQSMIPLGSCTMKLNATSEMLPIGWLAVTD